MRILRVLLPVALGAALLVPAGAAAATRYASPTGIGPPGSCPQADPCDLQDAVEDAAVGDGDEVVVTGGPYSESSQLDVGDAITVAKQPGAATPTINTTATIGIRVNDPGAVVRDLAINQTAGVTGLLVSEGTAERLRVRTSQANACGALSATGVALLRDSTCLNSNPSSGSAIAATIGAATGAYVSRLRNVTGYATGTNSIGLNADANGGAWMLVDARNVIVSGVLRDIRADYTAGSPPTLVSMTSSNYATEIEVSPGAGITDPGTGGNQITEPLLANPAGNDFAQLSGSPTINAGTVDGFLGTTDLAGAARIQESAPDIGADESDLTPPETSIESGPEPVARNNEPAFTFSSSEAGSTFECQSDLAALQPCTSPFTSPTLDQGSHVFRVRAIDGAGNADATPAEFAFAIDRGVSGANASAKRVQRQRGRNVSLTVSVKASEDTRVSAAAKLRLSKRKSFTLKSRAFDLDAGKKRKLALKPQKASASRKILKTLKRGGKVKGTLTATFTDGVGNKATTGKIEVQVKD